ncbi:MAG: HIT family protein [Pseudoflavonifractor sp.]|nr:HIT family protein [Alloprevotella sp.]MCM1117388.1 HIT family protein [Pseudoflavonifractor sp.]
MASIFSRIIAGEIPCYKIAEDDRHFAFLDINPVNPGHVLVVPKHEVSYIFDLADEEYAALTLFAKRVAEGLREAVPCKRVGVAVIGLEVPHAHIHLIPITNEGDMSFSTKHTLPAEEMERLRSEIAEKVAQHLA